MKRSLVDRNKYNLVAAGLGTAYLIGKAYNIWITPFFTTGRNPYDLAYIASQSQLAMTMLVLNMIIVLVATGINWAGYVMNFKLLMGICTPMYFIAILMFMSVDATLLYGALGLGFMGFMTTRTDNSLAQQVKKQRV